MRMHSPSANVSLQQPFASSLTPADVALQQHLAKIKPLPMATSKSGVVIPTERSHKQRNYAFCANPACAETNDAGQKVEFRFEIEDTLCPCPKCGANEAPIVGILAKTHLLLQDKAGHIRGAGGIRYRIACDRKNERHYISTASNHELATGERSVANCLDCLALSTPAVTATAMFLRG